MRGRKVGELSEGCCGVDGSGRVVRIAQQHCTCAVLERGADSVEVEFPPVSGIAQRNPLDDGTRLFHEIEERRIHRWCDDDTIAWGGDAAQQLDDAHADVRGRAHARRVGVPTVAAEREVRERLCQRSA